MTYWMVSPWGLWTLTLIHDRYSNSRFVYTFDSQLFVTIPSIAIDLFSKGINCVTKCLRNNKRLPSLACVYYYNKNRCQWDFLLFDFVNILSYGALLNHRITRQINIDRLCGHAVFLMRELKENGNC
jgi:hypothetical protein